MTLEATSAGPASRLVNGVFMGGGAKSIAYAGALRAAHERHLWFGSVAGSSAGAIVSALIASDQRRWAELIRRVGVKLD